MGKKLDINYINRIILENNIFKNVMDELIEGIYITDRNEKIMWMNKENEINDGMKKEAVLGKTEAEVYSKIGRYHRYTTQTGQAVSMRAAYYYLPDGQRTDVVLVTKPYFEQGKLEAVFTVDYNMVRLQKFFQVAMGFNGLHKPSSNPKCNRTTYTFSDIIGNSDEIRSTVKMAKKAALSRANVIIYGETGTGKELIAQSIHNASQEATGQFIPINCSAIPETLLESLLFGTSKGAFTGALDSPGLFEVANGGSLFLDEINSMPLNLQAKLLRVLQEKEVQRLGEKKYRPINCRVISASSIDPLVAVSNKTLRDDLYFRLSVITIYLPPLRVRKNDIPVLISYFLKNKKANQGGRKTISQSTLDLMKSYSWPGNIREIEHALEYALIMMEAEESQIENQHLPQRVVSGCAKKNDPNVAASNENSTDVNIKSLLQSLFEYEVKLITNALVRNGGHLTKTACELGISRQTLTNKIKRLRIELVSVKKGSSG